MSSKVKQHMFPSTLRDISVCVEDFNIFYCSSIVSVKTQA